MGGLFVSPFSSHFVCTDSFVELRLLCLDDAFVTLDVSDEIIKGITFAFISY